MQDIKIADIFMILPHVQIVAKESNGDEGCLKNGTNLIFRPE